MSDHDHDRTDHDRTDHADHADHFGHAEGPGGHSGHAHGVSADADRRWLTIALALIAAFMCAEVVVGMIANSLALISDAAHMLTDVASIVLALVAMKLAARPAKGMYTYGLKRVEILSAQANGLTLLLLSVWLAYESVHRLISPPQVTGALVLATALAGVAVNLAATWAISRANRTSMNVEGAYRHILTDLFGFIATAIAGVLVLTTGFARADALASLLVVTLMLKAGYGLVRDSARVFLEASPAGVDPDALGDRLAAQDAVVEIHDLHVWQITSGQNALSAHVLVTPGSDCHQVRRELQRLLAADYHIGHATLQVDHLGQDAADLLQITGTGESTAAAEGHCGDAHGPVHTSRPHEH